MNMTLVEQILNTFPKQQQIIENARVIEAEEVGSYIVDGDKIALMSEEEIKGLEVIDCTSRF